MLWQQVQQSQQQQEAQYDSESGDNTDVPASRMADKDSLFVEINGLNVHYKQAYPAKVCLLLSCIKGCFPALYPQIFCTCLPIAGTFWCLLVHLLPYEQSLSSNCTILRGVAMYIIIMLAAEVALQ